MTFQEKIKAGKFWVTVEFGPEKGTATQSFIEIGVALTGRVDYGGRGRTTFEVGLRFGLGYEPRSRRWLETAQPLADQGALSVHAFLDENANGAAEKAPPLI